MKFFCLLFLLLSCTTYTGKIPLEDPNLVYYTAETNERQAGEILIPKTPGPHPGVIVVHGGGWNSRDFQDMSSVAKSLVSHGFVVFNINYRLAPEHKHPAPIEDLDHALKYFKQHAAKFKLDPKRIGLWGYSSGGHIVSYYALKYAQVPERKVQAVVSGGAPYDFTWYPYSPIIKKYLGKFRDQMMDEYIEASPVFKVSSFAPPFFLYHGVSDKLVEFAQTTAFEARLKVLKVPVERHDVKWWGHATTFIFSEESVVNGISFLEKYL